MRSGAAHGCSWRGAAVALVAVLQRAACATAAAPARAHRTCSTAEFGSQLGLEVHIAEQRLLPGLKDWAISIPPVCPKIEGVRVTACDPEGAPAVRLRGARRGGAERGAGGSGGSGGALRTAAYAYVARWILLYGMDPTCVVVFCDPHTTSPRLLDLLAVSPSLKPSSNINPSKLPPLDQSPLRLTPIDTPQNEFTSATVENYNDAYYLSSDAVKHRAHPTHPPARWDSVKKLLLERPNLYKDLTLIIKQDPIIRWHEHEAEYQTRIVKPSTTDKLSSMMVQLGPEVSPQHPQPSPAVAQTPLTPSYPSTAQPPFTTLSPEILVAPTNTVLSGLLTENDSSRSSTETSPVTTQQTVQEKKFLWSNLVRWLTNVAYHKLSTRRQMSRRRAAPRELHAIGRPGVLPAL